MRLTAALLLLIFCPAAPACELCAVYNAGNALGESGGGCTLAVSEQFIPFRTSQNEGEETSFHNPSYVDSSITHLVPTYNFSPRFGISLNLPLTYLDFKRRDIRYSTTEPSKIVTETGTEFGLSDISLIGRVTVFQKRSMKFGLLVNLLAGVKFPTGDTDRLKDEVEQARIFNLFLPPGTPHDPLGHSAASVHQHNLALGSGSYDGVFGATVNSRWQRWFFNAQFQYYLRTEGEATFHYGDEMMISGGPGGFLLLDKWYTLSLQANAVYDTMARDELLGEVSDRTGSTAWYFGPLVNFTWGDHFSANAGIDIPLRIENNGFQSVPDYRVHGGLSWRF
jgi:hypothetical protein